MLIIPREKARIPAWCDRVLWKATNLRQIDYNVAPLRFSDHRPVYATFECIISFINEKHKKDLSRELYSKRRKYANQNLMDSEPEDSAEEDLLDYESIAPGLPAASSERRKWWLDNGFPAQSTIKPPTERHAPNPNRNPNPFAASIEPDWVHVSLPNAGADHPKPERNPADPNSPAVTRRKLPPPLIPQRRDTSPNLTSNTQDHEPSNPPSSRNPRSLLRASSATDTSSLQPPSSASSSAPPPPIPRKPAKLTSSPQPHTDPKNPSTRSRTVPTTSPAAVISNSDGPDSFRPRPLPTRHSTTTTFNNEEKTALSAASRKNVPPPPPVQPRKAGLKDQQQTDALPPPPPHPSLPHRIRETNIMKGGDGLGPGPGPGPGPGLLDGGTEEEAAMSSWQPLRPQR